MDSPMNNFYFEYKMTAPIQHNICCGAYLPILKRMVDPKDTYILFQDNYPTIYKRLGINRDEMMILMPQVMRVDVLSGLDSLSYVGEERAPANTTKQ